MMVSKMNRGARAFVLGVFPLIWVGCGGPGVVRPTSPLSSQRGVETLEMIPGEIPEWKAKGSIKVKAEGERDEEEFSMRVRVKEGDKLRTIDARGREVFVTGDGGNLKIAGGCSRLSVAGKKNRIHCDFANEIDIIGEANDVVCDSVGSGIVKGDGNTISWKNPVDSSSPLVDLKGVNNSLVHLDPKPVAPVRYKRSR